MVALIFLYYFILLSALFAVSYLIEKHYESDNNADNYKYSEHSLTHIRKRLQKSCSTEIFKHIITSLLQEEAEDKTARDNRRDLSRNVYTYRVHKQMVLVVLCKSHLMDNTS